MTPVGAENSRPLGEPVERFLEDFLNLSDGTRTRLGTPWRPSADVVAEPAAVGRSRLAERAGIGAEV